MASYLATVVIGDYVLQEEEGPDGLPIRNYFPPDLGDEQTAPFARTAEMIEFFGESFGPYPFEAYGAAVVDDPFFYAALEAQTLSVFGAAMLGSPDTELVVAEELAHQWFGDCVSPYEWRDIWLNEGFGTYASWMWREHTDGPPARDVIVRDTYAELSGQNMPPETSVSVSDQELDDLLAEYYPPPGDPPAGDLFNGGTYRRGALTLHALRLRLGDETFFDLLRAYVEQYRYGVATTDDFIALAEEVSGEDLGDFFAAWLYDAAMPDIPEMKLAYRVQAAVEADGVDVYQGPGVNYDLVDTADEGDTLRVLGQSSDCAWLQVRSPEGELGWVAGESVTLSHSCDFIPPAEFTPPLATVSETQAESMIESAVQAVVGQGSIVMALFKTIEGERTVNLVYTTGLDAQSAEFDSQLQQAIFVAVGGFVTADSAPTMLLGGALPANVGDATTPLALVGVQRSPALNWYNGQISDEAFVETWLIEKP
jgi:hypothetical protein